ncbi:MAG TPA: pilus assembly protein PilP [Thermodesulfovibrionales bacterium]|nr:pilus assembly protein PilP [Thermodesulfovibrionales bacterium]
MKKKYTGILSRVLFCHSRGSNPESTVFGRNRSLDSRLPACRQARRDNDSEYRVFYVLTRAALFLTLTFFVLTTITACKKEASKPAAQKQAGKVQVAPQASPAPAPVAKEEKAVEAEAYTYNPKGKRDPFFSIIEASKREKELEKKKKSLRPSESYDVTDVTIIAIAGDRNNYYAMIQLPDKKYFTVREGMTLGVHGGKIIKIDQVSVVVREQIKDFKGEIQSKDTVIRLRKEEGE